jgi:hypothetical protein
LFQNKKKESYRYFRFGWMNPYLHNVLSSPNKHEQSCRFAIRCSENAKLLLSGLEQWLFFKYFHPSICLYFSTALTATASRIAEEVCDYSIFDHKRALQMPGAYVKMRGG